MPIITFWSNNEKAIGQTVSAALATTVLAMEHNYKVLLISGDYENFTMENCFGAQESNKEIIKSFVKKPQVSLDSGMKGLLKLADSNKVTPEVIHDYTKIVFKNRLEVLYSPVKLEKEERENILEKIKNIILNASRYYDYVIVDLKKGLQYDEQMELLNASEVIVLNIDPGTKTIEDFLQEEKLQHLHDKIVWNICRSDNKSKYNTKNLTRVVLKKQNICEVPYNTLVLEASQEGLIAELLIRLKTLKDEDSNLVLVKKIQELVENILQKYQEMRSKM